MTFTYNVFLSHNSKDKPTVEAIARLLQEQYQFKCWLDKWNLVPGEPWQEGLEDALDDCETIAVFVGSGGISPWENKEMRAALQMQAVNKGRRVIPVLLPGAPDSRELKLPMFLTQMTWVDFRGGLHDDEALYRLYCGITGTKPGGSRETGKPTGGGLPYGSYVPFVQNKHFTGRITDLQSLADLLLGDHSTNMVISQAVTGMGGIGKTQLAVEFAYRYGQRFKGVHWLDLRDVSGLDGAIALCGTKMGYTMPDQRELLAATLKTWVEDGPRLLILDNFEELKAVHEVLARFQHPALRLLITSRRRDFPRSLGLRLQELGLFSPAESLDFLDKSLERPETDEAKKALAEMLGYLPLALQLAASYINIKMTGIEGYLKELDDISKLDSLQAEWFEELEIANPTDHEQSLFGTFQLSYTELKDETQQQIFLIAGYLAPNTPIPLEIFKETLELEEDALAKALYRKNALGLLPAENGLPTIHPLLAAFARTLAGSSKELLEKLAEKLAHLARQANDQVDQTGSLGWFVPLKAHVLLTAGFAEAAGVPYAAGLLGNLGEYLYKIADYRAAKSVYKRALKIDEVTFGPDHATLADHFTDLGMVLRALGELEGAKVAHERALKIDETTFGPDHTSVARDINNLGSVLKDLGDLAGARAAVERALKIGEAAFGPDHPKVAIFVNNLGNVLQDLGDRAAARAAYERALKIDEAAFGPDHPDVARDVNNLGSLLQDPGDLAGARAAFERALKILKKFLPEGHPNIRIVQGNLDSLLKKMSRE